MSILCQNESAFKNARACLLATFESDDFKERIDYSPWGICRSVDMLADHLPNLLFAAMRKHAFANWGRFSGNESYPIPHPRGEERFVKWAEEHDEAQNHGTLDSAVLAYDDYRSPNAHSAHSFMDHEAMDHDGAVQYLEWRWELVEHLKQWFTDLTHEQYKAYCGVKSQ